MTAPATARIAFKQVLRFKFLSPWLMRRAQFGVERVLHRRDSDDHQLQIGGAVVGEGMIFAEQGGYSIPLLCLFGLLIELNLAAAIHYVVNLFNAGVVMQSLRCPGRDQQM